MRRSLDKYEVIIFSIIIGLSAYVIDAEIDAFIFHDGPFLDVLLFAPLGEIYIRLYILASFVIFGIFISRILAKRKKAEEALRESERRYRNVIETAPDVIYTLSAEDGKITSLNPAFENLTGWSRDEWLGKSFASIVHPDDLPLAIETFQKILQGETLLPYELRVLSKSGEHLVGEFTSIPLIENGKVVGEFGIVRDITERKMMEQERRESEGRLKSILDSIESGVLVIDPETHMILDVNAAAMEMFGAPKGRIIGSICHKFICPAEKGRCPITDLEQTVDHSERILVKANGESMSIIKTVVPITLSGRKQLIESFVDITERNKAEEALRESEERFRGIVANTGDWVWEVDADGKYTYVSPIVEQILGYKPEEVLGKHFYDFFLPEERQQLKEAAFEVFARRECLAGFVNRNIHKSGRVVILETSGVPILSADGRLLGYRGADRDATERKMLEERLSALNFYGGKLNTTNSLQQVYELTLDAMEQTLGFENATLMVVEKGNLKVACQRGYSKPILLELPLDGTKRGITVRAANTSKPILVSDVKKDKDYVESVPGIRSEVAVPVVVEDNVLGVLDVESRKVGAFDEKDTTLLQILASHAATAISNLTKRGEIEKRSSQLASLMKSSAEMIHSTDLRQRLQTTAEAVQELGWRRVVISARDENLDIANPEDIVTAGLTKEEREFLWTNRQPGQVWRERFGLEYERFKIGEFYHLPWSDPWVREKFSKGTVPSYLKPEEMVDWDPQDLLYAPLRLADGRIVGVVSIDDPLDGKRPTKESLAPLELFIHQAAVAIENAKLIQWLNEAKKQIEEYADQLELKVKQRTKELMEAQNRLLKSERLAAIGEVAAMVGHDLRNPLTGIAGATYYLKMKSGPKMNKKTREMLELIEGDIEYSNKIINDLLEYSREMQLELIEATPKIIIKEALSLVKVPKNIQVSDSTRTEPRIRVDVEKMKRVFVNIIKNAIDAMPKGGKLTIKSKKTDGNLEIAFADTGIGMSKDVVEKLWTPLFTTKAKGMGLGLPICKRAVEAHGGNISAESTVGKGTTFTVTIPIQPQLEGGEKIWVNIPESLLSKTTKA